MKITPNMDEFLDLGIDVFGPISSSLGQRQGLNFTNSAHGANSKKLDCFGSFSKILLFIKRPSFLNLMPCAELVKLSLGTYN